MVGILDFLSGGQNPLTSGGAINPLSQGSIGRPPSEYSRIWGVPANPSIFGQGTQSSNGILGHPLPQSSNGILGLLGPGSLNPMDRYNVNSIDRYNLVPMAAQ